MRVANDYFASDTRAVSMYTRKAGGEVVLITIEDVQASLPEEMAGMIMPQLEAQIAEIGSMSVDQINEAIAEIDSQKEMIPPPMQKLMEFIQQEMRIRLDAIESNGADASEGGDE